MRSQIEAALAVVPAPSATEAPLAARDFHAVLGAIDDLARVAQARAAEACRDAFELPAATGDGVGATAMGEAITRIRAQVSHAEVDGDRAGRVVGLLDFVEANLGDMMATWSDLEALRRRTGSSAR